MMGRLPMAYRMKVPFYMLLMVLFIFINILNYILFCILRRVTLTSHTGNSVCHYRHHSSQFVTVLYRVQQKVAPKSFSLVSQQPFGILI